MQADHECKQKTMKSKLSSSVRCMSRSVCRMKEIQDKSAHAIRAGRSNCSADQRGEASHTARSAEGSATRATEATQQAQAHAKLSQEEANNEEATYEAANE